MAQNNIQTERVFLYIYFKIQMLQWIFSICSSISKAIQMLIKLFNHSQSAVFSWNFHCDIYVLCSLNKGKAKEKKTSHKLACMGDYLNIVKFVSLSTSLSIVVIVSMFVQFKLLTLFMRDTHLIYIGKKGETFRSGGGGGMVNASVLVQLYVCLCVCMCSLSSFLSFYSIY